MATFLKEMQQQRALAVAERAKIDQRIAALDVLIAQEREHQQPIKATAPARGKTRVAPTKQRKRGPRAAVSMATHIANALAAGGECAVADLPAKIKEADGVIVTVRALGAVLPRLVKDGKVVRVGRGRYALPTNADSPASTGLSVVPIPTTERTEHAHGEGDDHLSRRHDGNGGNPPLVAQG
jgi:hypothetical protein